LVDEANVKGGVIAERAIGSGTPRYTAIMGGGGDLVCAIADMEAFNYRDNWRVPEVEELRGAKGLVLDCNVPPTVMKNVLERYGRVREEGGVVLVDPTSVEKAILCKDVLLKCGT